MKKSQAAAARAALGAHLQPQLAQDGALPTFRALFAKPTTVKALAEDAAKAFPDAKLDVAALTKALQFALDEAADPDKKPDKAEDEDEDDKDKKAEDEDDEDDPDKAEDEDDEKDDDKVDKKAMDAALKAVERNTIKRMNSIRDAEEEVRPLIGAVVAQDSAEAVYKLALDAAKVDLTDVPPSAYRALVRMHKQTQVSKAPVHIALDAASDKSFADRYPTAGKLKRG